MVGLRYLLDTNVVSEPLRPAPNPGILRNLQTHQGSIGIAALVWHELWFGCRLLPPSRKRDAIEAYLGNMVRQSFPVLSYEPAAAEWHATERARLHREGKPTAFVDGQIAAIAAVQGLVLVTANRSHFLPFTGLAVEDWRADQ